MPKHEFGLMNNPPVESKRYDKYNPESFEKYHSVIQRQYPYYRIYVKNYTVYYVVIDDVMEVRRLVYNKRNITEQIWIFKTSRTAD